MLSIPGSTISEVLGDVQYHTTMLERAMKEQIDRAIKADVLKPNEGMRLLESYEQGLKTSTYLKINGPERYKNVLVKLSIRH